MKFRLLWVILLLVGVLGAPAAQMKIRSLKVGAKVFKNVTVLGFNATDVYFTHEDGIANVRLKYLNEDLQRRFNYDAQAATEAERQQVEEDKRFQTELASQIEESARVAARERWKATASGPTNLLDPVSDKTLVGTTNEPPKPELWLGEQPDLKGKFVVWFYWTPWSYPSRQAIPALNAIQKAFPQQVRVVGLTTEPAADIEKMETHRPEFAVALDPEGKITDAAGIREIPYVVFTDPKGIVRYYGHPAGLGGTNISALLPPPPEP